MWDHDHERDLERFGICRVCADRAILGTPPEDAQLTLDELLDPANT